ncbi:SRPBCC family protein [Actinoplanes sp. NPDC024001]|uniref:SRPBCC family protein n=1 Tax=Actinoplanes sp. NPDC024001 TaxID=3154598 RepID=UPI0033F922BA
MASIRKEVQLSSTADDAWKVIGDFATGPSRMAPGFVVDTRADGDQRTVTFADGTVAQERLIAVDHDARRIVYALVGPEHDNASMQVVDDGHGCRLIWIHDVLPDGVAARIEAAMTQGLAVIRRTL